MSQLADVNTQSSVGMFHFHDVLHCSNIEHIQLFTVTFLALSVFTQRSLKETFDDW